MPEIELKKISEEWKPNSFWDKPFGRTLRAKNKAGKIIYSVVGIGGSIVAGVNINPILNLIGTDMEFLELLQGDLISVILGLLVIVLAIAGVFLKGTKQELVRRAQKIVSEVRVGKNLYDEFKRKESAQGEELSPEEYKQLGEQLGVIIKLIFARNKDLLDED